MAKIQNIEQEAMSAFFSKGNIKQNIEEREERISSLMKTVEVPFDCEVRKAPKRSLVQCYCSKGVKELITKYAEEDGVSQNDLVLSLLNAYIEARESSKQN